MDDTLKVEYLLVQIADLTLSLAIAKYNSEDYAEFVAECVIAKDALWDLKRRLK